MVFNLPIALKMTENNDAKKAEIEINKEKCLSFLNISEKIRYVGIINKFGRTVTGKLKNGIRPLLTPEQARDERYIESTRQQLRKDLEISIGKSIFTIEKNENVVFLLIPDKFKDYFYYITLEKDTPLVEINDIIDKINEKMGW
ncbi:MAG: hypothetical protein H0X50_00740 [Nitrosopumilus sp.]|nr:hypothetical protein [Nitrosopumilus sp.]